jgi:hypothetical protein
MKKTIIVSATGIAIVAAAILALLPAIGTHCTSPMTRDLNNLHQIGLACTVFAIDHAGCFPEDWSQLAPYFSVDASKFFVTTRSKGTGSSMTNVMEWTDYVYIRGITTAAAPSTVVAFLPPTAYRKRTVALVLFADARVERQSPEEFVRTMNRSPNASQPIGAPHPER